MKWLVLPLALVLSACTPPMQHPIEVHKERPAIDELSKLNKSQAKELAMLKIEKAFQEHDVESAKKAVSQMADTLNRVDSVVISNERGEEIKTTPDMPPQLPKTVELPIPKPKIEERPIEKIPTSKPVYESKPVESKPIIPPEAKTVPKEPPKPIIKPEVPKSPASQPSKVDKPKAELPKVETPKVEPKKVVEKPKADLTIDLGNNVSMEFILIPAGAFTMGEDDSKHNVVISKPFYIGKYEVTQEQWKAVMDNNPSQLVGDKLPVTNVSWIDAQSFCKSISTKYHLSLPTEAQWEYVCSRSNISDINEYAWTGQNAKSIREVGTKKADSSGVFDLRGNVWEWCSDWFEEQNTDKQIDPIGPENGTMKVARGGSAFTGNMNKFKSTYRNPWSPDTKDPYVGFRMVAH